MSDPNFMVNFVKSCVANGSNTTEAMIEAAQDQIKNIDSKLKTMEALKIKKIKLQSVLKQLGTPKQEKQDAADWDFSLELSQMDDYRRDLMASICNYIEEHPCCKPTEIRDAVASYEEQNQIYWAIKWLSGRNVIGYDDNRSIIKGADWSSRPSGETNERANNE